MVDIFQRMCHIKARVAIGILEKCADMNILPRITRKRAWLLFHDGELKKSLSGLLSALRPWGPNLVTKFLHQALVLFLENFE